MIQIARMLLSSGRRAPNERKQNQNPNDAASFPPPRNGVKASEFAGTLDQTVASNVPVPIRPAAAAIPGV